MKMYDFELKLKCKLDATGLDLTDMDAIAGRVKQQMQTSGLSISEIVEFKSSPESEVAE